MVEAHLAKYDRATCFENISHTFRWFSLSQEIEILIVVINKPPPQHTTTTPD